MGSHRNSKEIAGHESQISTAAHSGKIAKLQYMKLKFYQCVEIDNLIDVIAERLNVSGALIVKELSNNYLYPQGDYIFVTTHYPNKKENQIISEIYKIMAENNIEDMYIVGQ